MTWWHDANGKPSQAALRKIVRCLVRTSQGNKGAYLGELALELGLGISTIEGLMGTLIDEGTAREMTPAEKHRLGIEAQSIVYVLIKRPEVIDIDDWVNFAQ